MSPVTTTPSAATSTPARLAATATARRGDGVGAELPGVVAVSPDWS
jgi:hypothetical protein